MRLVRLALRGPWTLSGTHINNVVSRRSPGIYALGRRRGTAFDPCCVGRADDDIRGELLRHVRAYPLFEYGYCSSAVEAFEQECQAFHDLADAKPLDNTTHPQPPVGSGLKCPRCGSPGLEEFDGAADASTLATLRPETWHPTIKALYTYWVSLHPSSGLPGRQHIDPAADRRLAPHLFLVDVSRNPPRFRYNLVGSDYARQMGRDLSGRYLDQVHPGFHGLILRQYVETVELRQPAYRKGAVMYKDHHRRTQGDMERLILPLARNGADVDMMLGAVVVVAEA
jgi:hypothetical protein